MGTIEEKSTLHFVNFHLLGRVKSKLTVTEELSLNHNPLLPSAVVSVVEPVDKWAGCKAVHLSTGGSPASLLG